VKSARRSDSRQTQAQFGADCDGFVHSQFTVTGAANGSGQYSIHVARRGSQLNAPASGAPPKAAAKPKPKSDNPENFRAVEKPSTYSQ